MAKLNWGIQKKSDTQFAKSPNYSGHHISYKAQSHVQFGGNSNATNKFKPEPPITPFIFVDLSSIILRSNYSLLISCVESFIHYKSSPVEDLMLFITKK